MSTTETVRACGMLTTRIDARDSSVTTCLGARRPWVAVWQGPAPACVFLRFYEGRTTPGGLAEAHQAIVAQVREGTLPQREREAWATLDAVRGREPDVYDSIVRAAMRLSEEV